MSIGAKSAKTNNKDEYFPPPGWEEQYEGHNLELVPMIDGAGKVGVVTMFWRFTMNDGVLAVALTQKLVEEREKATMDEYSIECHYKEEEWEE